MLPTMLDIVINVFSSWLYKIGFQLLNGCIRVNKRDLPIQRGSSSFGEVCVLSRNNRSPFYSMDK